MEIDARYCLAEWQKSVVSGDYQRGLSVAVQGYEWALSQSDEVHQKMFLCFAKLAADELFKLHIQQRPAKNVSEGHEAGNCSFCGKPFDSVLMVHGVDAAICRECIQLASTMTRK